MILFPTHGRDGKPLGQDAPGSPMMVCIDVPSSMDVVANGACRFSGWVVTASGRPVQIRASFGDVRRDFVANRPRPDVVAHWKGQYPATVDPCGFRFHLDLRGHVDPLGVTLEFDDGDFLAASPPFSVRHARSTAGER